MSSLVDKAIWGIHGEFSFLTVIMALFFALWNTMCSPIIVVPVVRGLFFGCRAFWQSTSPILLIFPHWYLGIGMPCIMGGLVSASVAVGLPYFFIIYKTVNQALKEQASQSANEATKLKYDVLDVLKQVQSEVEDADHVDDVKAAVQELLKQLADVKCKDGSQLLDQSSVTADSKDPSVPQKDDPDNPDETNETNETNEPQHVTSSKSQLTIASLARTVSGAKHFQTGVKKRDIPIVQGKLVRVSPE